MFRHAATVAMLWWAGGFASAKPPSIEVLGARRGALEIRSGDAHSCARLRNGRVACWGGNAFGQLGDGSLTPRPKPVEVKGLKEVVALATGEYHSCAIRAQRGQVWCWGRNHRGQLGSRRGRSSRSPARVRGAEPAVAIGAGETHTCAIRPGGEVWCWGNGSARPRPVPGLKALAVAAGEGFTCALRTDHRVACWGDNREGQLGRAPGRPSPHPVEVPEVRDAREIAAGEAHACALLSGGGVRCWGRNSDGQVGGAPSEDPRSPVLPAVLRGSGRVVGLAAGEDHTCAVLGDGRVRCWGNGESGQADGTSVGAFKTRMVSAGEDHSCALLRSGAVRCWGGNEQGQSGRPIAVGSVYPRLVGGVDAAVAVATGEGHSCALLRDGTVSCWGRNHRGQLGYRGGRGAKRPARVPGIARIRALAAGDDHTCAITKGEVWCWGAGRRGQLGNGARRDRARPGRVPGVKQASSICAGKHYSCGATRGGRVFCWGGGKPRWFPSNRRETVRRIPGVSDAVSVRCGERRACALSSAGVVRCWTPGSAATPVAGLAKARRIAVGEEHACALVDDGSVWCWGENDEGQHGNGAYARSARPARTSLENRALKLTAGEAHTCALLEDRTVRCWGANARGQLGDGTREGRARPARPRGVAGAIDLSAGEAHTCIVRTDGAILCWGGQAALPWESRPRVTDAAEVPFSESATTLSFRLYLETRLRDHLDIEENRTRNRFRVRLRVSGELFYRDLFLAAGIRTASDGVAGLTSDNFTVDGSAWPIPTPHLASIGYLHRGTWSSYLVVAGRTTNTFQLNPLLRDMRAVGRATVQSLRMFDRDHTPVGASVAGAWQVGDARLFSTAALWALGAQGGLRDDVTVGLQAGVVFPALAVAASFYHFGRPGGDLALFSLEQGNSANPAGSLANEYRVLSLGGRLDLHRLLGLRGASLQFEYLRNLGAPDRAQGFYLQLRSAAGTRVQLLVDGFWMEADATLAAFADSDRGFTDVVGFSTAVAVRLASPVDLAFQHFSVSRLSTDGPLEHRLFLSLTFRLSK